MVDPHHYEISGEHARGGLGRVLRAHDRRLKGTVALKELLDARGPAARTFAREVEITAKLQHPPSSPSARPAPTGETFCAMKLVEGRSIRAIADEPDAQARLALVRLTAGALRDRPRSGRRP